jgi:transposase
MTIYAGLDVSDKITHVCVVDAEGAVVCRDVVATDPCVVAKHVFQIYGCDAGGKVIVAKAPQRKDILPFFAALGPCVVGMEA